MNDVFFKGVWRMDWGLGNANTTAALIAILMIAVWIFAYMRKWGFWISIVVFLGLGVCLIHTFSRGGLLALFAGCIPLVLFAKRPWPRSRLIALIAGFWIMVGITLLLNAHARYGLGLASEDRSITNRLLIWRSVPQMINDSPSGWGIGNAANAYVQWYQPIERGETYLHLVSSHLTWLVEFSWPLRLLYIFGWFSVFLICWPSSRDRWLAVPLGVWIAFFTAAVFSAVAESAWLWILPGGFLLAALGCRVFKRRWLKLRMLWVPTVATAVACAAILLPGGSGEAISGSSQTVTLGRDPLRYVVLYDKTAMGSLYGKNFRMNRKEFASEGVALVFNPGRLPSLKDRILVLGSQFPSGHEKQTAAAASEADSIILLSPKFFPQEFPVNPSKITVCFGDFSQSPSVQSWSQSAHVEQIVGAGDFLPDWPRVIIDAEQSPHSQTR